MPLALAFFYKKKSLFEGLQEGFLNVTEDPHSMGNRQAHVNETLLNNKLIFVMGQRSLRLPTCLNVN